ncbi:MAG: xanthine dehydrogenase family protein molybdopterin-binding subunit [Chloroflexi bacterium]|nr:xanthine dehydrogenase family protein molybdopterin-binding subunit [Chloroflexota bacterium]
MVATRKAATAARSTNGKNGFKVIGTRPIRHDGLDKVTGRAIYGADLKLPGLAQGAVLRSPHAHARIKRIDTSKAEGLPGVYAVITGKDFPYAASKEVDLGEGATNLKWASNNVMAGEKVVYKGQPVAAVAAVDLNTALEACGLIHVEYEPLKPVRDVKEAVAKDAPIALEDLVGDDAGEKVRKTNIARHFVHEFGDIEVGFKKAKLIVEHEYELATVHQGYIELHNGTAVWTPENRVTIWTSTQGAFTARRQIAGILQLDESRVKVVPLEIGGGFGGKIPVYVEPVAAVLSKKCGRPVKIVMDRKAVFESTGPTPAGTVWVKMGVDDKGKIVAAHADIRFEAGGYPGSPVGAGAMCVFAAYNIPNTRIDGYDIITNKPKTAAYRAPGSTHVAFATEGVIDEIIEKLGADKIEFRLKNAAKEGTRRADGPIYPRVGCEECLNAARDSDHWRSRLVRNGPNGRKRGRGIATGYWFNVGLKSSVTISVNRDGTVALIEGSTDIGGTRASIAMQAAEVLGIAAEDVRPVVVDTESVGYTDVTGGSRTCYATGYAAYHAANNVIAIMKERAAKLWDIEASSIDFKGGVFFSKTDSELKLTFKELAEKVDETGGPVSATGSVDLSAAGGGFGVHICDLEVDPETGKVDILRYTTVQDVGRAIHPSYVEGQMQGGAVQGIGWALNEEYYMDDQCRMVNSTLLDYRMPTALDLPKIETILVEVPNPIHPFGVRGVGETPIAPPVAAVANAIYDAIGVRLRIAPMKPAVILEALAQQKQPAGSKKK